VARSRLVKSGLPDYHRQRTIRRSSRLSYGRITLAQEKHDYFSLSGGNGLLLTLRVTRPSRHTFGFSPLIGGF